MCVNFTQAIHHFNVLRFTNPCTCCLPKRSVRRIANIKKIFYDAEVDSSRNEPIDRNHPSHGLFDGKTILNGSRSNVLERASETKER